MNISITIDDNGNPIFSQEGMIDIDSVIKDVLIDRDELKDVFTDKFKKLAESIEIDNKKIKDNITKGVTELFTFSSDFKKEVQSTFNKKINEVVDGISIDKKMMQNNIDNLFTYKDKNKQLKSVFDKINESIPDELVSKPKASSKKDDVDGGMDYLASLARRNNGLLPIDLQNIIGNVFTPHIIDVNVVGLNDDPFVEQLSTAISQKNYDLLSPLFDYSDVGVAQAVSGGGDGEDTVFDTGATPVNIMDIEPSLLEKLQKTQEMSDDDKSTKDVKKSGGILKWLSGLLGFGSVTSFAAMKTGFMSSLKAMVKLPASALKFATNPITLLLAGVVWGVVDGIKAAFKADEWGVSKLSAGLGGFLAGSVDGMIANMGKWALIGAGVGSVVPIIGTLAGGLVGAIIGAIFNALGAEKIAKGFDGLGKWFDEHFGGFIDGITTTFTDIFNEISYTWGQIQTWYDQSLKPAIDKFKMDMQPIFERVGRIFNEQVIPTITKTFETMSPVFEGIAEFISETFWPGVKSIASFFGEKLIDTFEFLPLFFDELITQTGVVVDKIKGAFEKLGEAMYWIYEKIEGIVNGIKKLKFWGDDEEKQRKKQLKELEDAQENRIKQQERLAELNAKLAEFQSREGDSFMFNKERAIAKTQAEMLEAQKEIAELTRKEKELKIATADGTTGATMKVQDASIAPNSLQVQLDQKDTLETIGNQSLYSKEGGTLDNAINQVAEKLQKQLDEMAMFKEMFTEYIKYVSKYNSELLQVIPTLAQSSGEGQIPAETSIPSGYIRDPNYEWKMRMREVFST